MDERPTRLLLIDADPAGHARIERLLAEIGDPTFRLDWLVDLASACRQIDRGEYDLYLIDLGLAYENNLGLIRDLRDAPGQPAVILLSGAADAIAVDRALKSGAADCLDRHALDAATFRRSMHYALERRRLQRELERERYLLHTLMDHLPDNIYFKDVNSRFLRVSRELAKRFGLSDPDDVVSLSDADFFTDEHAVQAREDEMELMRTGEPLLRKEEKETWPNGRVTWVTSSKLPLRDRQGRVVGTFGMSRDITHQKQVELELMQAKEAAEAASRAKSTFLATMSHEIRTPLNAVIGVADLLQETPLTPEQREYLSMVQESGESLLSIIEDILDFSKIEAGRFDLDQVDFNLRERIGDALRSLALRAHRKDLELAWHVRADVPLGVCGDPGRLRQILVNLVNNAIKFTEQGEVLLQVWPESNSLALRDAQHDDHVTLHFAVRDTGIGIPPDKLDKVFEPFEQVDSTTTRRYEGTGLGLAICSRLVDLMGGRIWVESELGRGSTFHFTARFAAARQLVPTASRPVPVRLAGLRVLVVDDNATNRLILEEMLRQWRMQPRGVASAAEALEALASANSNSRPFDVLLTDGNMPEMDGFALVEQIRQSTQFGNTLVMMLTSGDRPGDLGRCAHLGISAFLLKPVKPSELLESIARALGMPATPTVRRSPAPSVTVPGLCILLAEDSVINQKLAVGLLERAGHRVVVVSNGREAMISSGQASFDLVLMDLQMPELDGLAATAAIRAREKQTGEHVPIIAMTAHALKGDQERCLAAGMDGYIAKPVRMQELYKAIAEVYFAQSPASAPSSVPSPGKVDWSVALECVEGDRSLLANVVAAFLKECPSRLAELRQAIADDDSPGVCRQAHTLKSALNAFGAFAAATLAAHLEQQGALNKLDGSRQTTDELASQLDEVLQEVAAGAGDQLALAGMLSAGVEGRD